MIKRAAVLLVGAGCFLGAAAGSATPYDDQANLIIHEKIGEVFAQV